MKTETVEPQLETYTPGIWYRLADSWPPDSETVWLCNPEKGFAGLGCVVWDSNEGAWFWAYSNGVIYAENNRIVSECEFDDEIDYTHWSPLPVLSAAIGNPPASRCCGRCDGVNEVCIGDTTCEVHSELGCEICFGTRYKHSEARFIRPGE